MAPERKGRVGSAGRFGTRYGRIARKRVGDIEREMNADHECPECEDDRVSRAGTGIWECEACGFKFAGGCYRPRTPTGETVERSIRAALSEDE